MQQQHNTSQTLSGHTPSSGTLNPGSAPSDAGDVATKQFAKGQEIVVALTCDNPACDNPACDNPACDDRMIPEHSWEQKAHNIQYYQEAILGISEGWRGQFGWLSEFCKVVYLERLLSISITAVKCALSNLDSSKIKPIKHGLDGRLSRVKAIV